MFNDIKEKTINNPIIKKIIEKLNLNNNQIDSGIDIFLKIIKENEQLDNLDFITQVQIYDENSVIAINVPNQKTFDNIKKNKFQILNQISKVDSFISFQDPKNKKNSLKANENIFYWEYPSLKKENDRKQLGIWLTKFYKNNNNNLYTKGIYIYGDFGLGKTFFLKAFTNYLISKEIYVAYANINDLYDFFIKNVDKNNEINYEAINKFKNVKVLIIDDIGSEKQNNWFLFSILYPILEYRLENNLTTCFSSLFSINDLKKYWSKSKDLDIIKIQRLVDKIKSLTDEIQLSGKNIRNINKKPR